MDTQDQFLAAVVEGQLAKREVAAKKLLKRVDRDFDVLAVWGGEGSEAALNRLRSWEGTVFERERRWDLSGYILVLRKIGACLKSGDHLQALAVAMTYIQIPDEVTTQVEIRRKRARKDLQRLANQIWTSEPTLATLSVACAIGEVTRGVPETIRRLIKPPPWATPRRGRKRKSGK